MELCNPNLVSKMPNKTFEWQKHIYRTNKKIRLQNAINSTAYVSIPLNKSVAISLLLHIVVNYCKLNRPKTCDLLLVATQLFRCEENQQKKEQIGNVLFLNQLFDVCFWLNMNECMLFVTNKQMKTESMLQMWNKKQEVIWLFFSVRCVVVVVVVGRIHCWAMLDCSSCSI